MKKFILLAVFLVIAAPIFAAPAVKWAGMRGPCKVSAEDGLDTQQLGKKIGKFLVINDPQQWLTMIKTVNGKFEGSTPWVTWGVGKLQDAESLSDEQNEAALTAFDKEGVKVFLEVWPTKNDDPVAMIDTWANKFKHHPSIIGVSVDVEYYHEVDDASAKRWDEKIKSINPEYRMMLKHWAEGNMPPTYRGKGDIVFVNNSSEATPEALNAEYVQWADRYAPSAVAFMIGYPSDEDGMDGDKTKGWAIMNDPIKDWGDSLVSKLKNDQQEVGIIWVTAKSGKTYNTGWDLTKGQSKPDPGVKTEAAATTATAGQ